MIIFAIDPGSRESGYCIWRECHGILESGKIPNQDLLEKIRQFKGMGLTKFLIEQITLYQKSTQEIQDTIWWYGRFSQVLYNNGYEPVLITRTQVKKTLLPGLKTSDRNDSTISAYLKDRFAPGVRNHGKGTKSEPGYFYGMTKDAWQAFALAVAYHDMQMESLAA